MYVVKLTYCAPLERVDAALEAHRAFLKRHFEAGVFLIAGPRIPREGGVILATGIDRAQLDAILATDPFAEQQLATYEITEFSAARLAPGIDVPNLK
ncbi:YciI family protein [Paraburkholderia phosphatilytica]|uniref:YciI family protein n=1 Tax=Paraburkholderia phosphatilytica TaxID=2282883 RepID=UPI000E50277D|nr:YciI family protein [Paraburkholderia phosphatilytica]